jgi:Na+-driven multidrug efflux pump
VLTLGVFAPSAYAVQVAGAGLVWLWCALGAFMLARLATLLLRARSDAWLRTGPARGRLPDPERSPPVPEG